LAAAAIVLSVPVTAVCGGDDGNSPSSTSISTIMGACSPPQLSVTKPALGVTACFPAGWGPPSGDPDSLDQEAGFIIYGPPRREGEGIRIRVDFASPGATFAGCTPAEPSPVASLQLFCEDVYDVLPSGESQFSPSGGLTAWKFLTAVGPRELSDQSWPSGHIYVKAVMPSADRDELSPQLLAALATFKIDP
jgi:hypothetical protein